MRVIRCTVFCLLLLIGKEGVADHKLVSKDSFSLGAEGLVEREGLSPKNPALILCKEIYSGDSIVVTPPNKKQEEPSFQLEGPILMFLVGVISLLSGMFSPVGILIAGGVFLVLGVVLLLFYNKLKKVQPFKIRGHPIIGKIILALFFFVFLVTLFSAVIVAFTVGLALLITALASTLVSPMLLAVIIIGGGVFWMLVNAIVYWIRKRRYIKSLK